MNRAVLAIVLLIAVYALMLSSVHPLDLALGALLATATVVGLRRLLFPAGLGSTPRLTRRLLAAPLWAAAVVREITVGTWDVALVVLGVRPLRSPGIVELPIDDRSDLAVVAAALAATLSPGELVVDIEWERRVVLMHVLDGGDPAALRERWRSNYERYQRAALP